MKKKRQLILEYAKLAALNLSNGKKTIDDRMKEIINELQMTDEAIIRRATELATETFK
jgi:hypothetical protein